MGAPVRYQPDLLYWEGELRAGVPLEVDSEGCVCAPGGPGPFEVVRLPGRAMLPGLVNAHSHAFQRLIRGRTEYVAKGRESEDFWSWRERMYQAALALGPEDVYAASRQAFLEMALTGITTVGEFHYLHHGPDGTPYADRNELATQVVRAARDVGLRIALLRVGYARAGFQVEADPRQRRFIDRSFPDVLGAAEGLRGAFSSDACVSVGIAPHSVRAVPREWLREAAAYPGIVHMHVAEQVAEVAACVAEHGLRPVELLKELGLLHERFTAVHAVNVEAHEVAALGWNGSTVCACPSTERNLGDGIVPADALLAAGARIALGTDSELSLDLLDEARQLESHLRLLRGRRAVLDPGGGAADGLAKRLLDIATVLGSRSLGTGAGGLAVGSPADFFTVDLEHPALAGAGASALIPTIVFGGDPRLVREVAVAGKVIVENGLHPLAAESAREMTALTRRLFS